MNVYILCGFLLISAVVAVPVTNEEELVDGSQPTEDLYVFDDDKNLVKLDLSLDLHENLNETRMNLPKSVIFHLYTRSNPISSEILQFNNVEALTRSKFNPNKETKFVTHGWINSRRSEACTLVRDAFLEHGDYNVIVVDWSKISVKPYLWASNRVVMVSLYISTMIDFLVTQGMKPSDVTFVGHSLGAHVASLSSYYFRQKLSYVVALDPALPNFALTVPGGRVSKGDADYVQVIHTNGGMLGYSKAIGDADFYPNGGRKQMNCLIDVGGSCSHCRSYEYFAESINTVHGFYGRSCSSYTNYMMGLCKDNPEELMGNKEPQHNVTGKYYLKTHLLPPFAKGHHNSSAEQP